MAARQGGVRPTLSYCADRGVLAARKRKGMWKKCELAEVHRRGSGPCGRRPSVHTWTWVRIWSLVRKMSAFSLRARVGQTPRGGERVTHVLVVPHRCKLSCSRRCSASDSRFSSGCCEAELEPLPAEGACVTRSSCRQSHSSSLSFCQRFLAACLLRPTSMLICASGMPSRTCLSKMIASSCRDNSLWPAPPRAAGWCTLSRAKRTANGLLQSQKRTPRPKRAKPESVQND